MGLFKKLMKNVKDQARSIDRLPTEPKGIGSILGGRTRRKELDPNVINPSLPRVIETDPRPAPVPTGIEALIRPQRTDPGGQEDMRKLMDMQRQTFRSFLAPPPPDFVIQPGPYFPVDGGDLGLPTGPGTPMPPGTIFEGEVGGTPINIQEILDNLPKGVGVGGIGSIPVPDIPYEIPQITVPGVSGFDLDERDAIDSGVPMQVPQELLDSVSNPVTIPLPTIEPPISLPKLPIDLPVDLPIQVPPVEDFVMPSLPLELPLQLPQLEKFTAPSLPMNIPQSAVDALGIGALNIQPSLPVLETKPTPVVSMPAMQAVNEVSIPKVAVDIPKYNYNDPARLARRDAYFASSRFD